MTNRTFNYTNRSHFPQECVVAELKSKDGVALLSVDVILENAPNFSGFDDAATIVLEAEHGTSFMRLDLGTIKQPKSLDAVPLNDLESPDSAQIQLKIVQGGKLLALSSRWTLNSAQPDLFTKRTLIDFSHRDLGDLPWTIDLGEHLPRPMLIFNSKWVEKHGASLTEDPLVLANVLPQVLHRILTKLLMVDRISWGEQYDDTGWEGMWIRLAHNHHQVSLADSAGDADRLKWIEDAVQCFCASKSIMTALTR